MTKIHTIKLLIEIIVLISLYLIVKKSNETLKFPNK